jgi:hypothetical protein
MKWNGNSRNENGYAELSVATAAHMHTDLRDRDTGMARMAEADTQTRPTAIYLAETQPTHIGHYAARLDTHT